MNGGAGAKVVAIPVRMLHRMRVWMQRGLLSLRGPVAATQGLRRGYLVKDERGRRKTGVSEIEAGLGAGFWQRITQEAAA